MDKVTLKQFRASVRSRVGLGVSIVLVLSVGITEAVETGLRHRLSGALWIVAGVYLAWCLVKSFRFPVLALDQECVEYCTVYDWKLCRVQRSNLERVMWQKPALIRFFSRDGMSAEIKLSSLSSEDRVTVRKYLELKWGIQGLAI